MLKKSQINEYSDYGMNGYVMYSTTIEGQGTMKGMGARG
jgi:hypothetical protein